MPLQHHRAGKGHPVLLLHAGVADARMWNRQFSDLKRQYDLLAPDLRGYGETPLATGESYSDATDVLNLLDELRLTEVTAVGASYGAHVLLQAVTQQPQRFQRLVLLCPLVEAAEPTEDIQQFEEDEDRLLEAGALDAATSLNVNTWLGPETDGQMRDLVWDMQRHAFAVQSAAGEVNNAELHVDPSAIEAPVHIYSGAHDLTYFRRGAAVLAAQLVYADHTVLPWAGHLPTLERPAEGTSLILQALPAASP